MQNPKEKSLLAMLVHFTALGEVMQVKKISTETLIDIHSSKRPESFDTFLGQSHIKSVMATAIDSAKKRQSQIGHTLFSGPSGYGKTTLANIISKQMQSNIKAVTGYAIPKPAEIVSILNSLDEGDILFIDEIHRLRPNVEEVLYIAMEDFVIDMVMPDGGSVRVPIAPFTLIGATTQAEKLTPPLKNRFVYNFHFMEYSPEEKQQIISRYLQTYQVTTAPEILDQIHKKVDAVPREIHNLCVKIRDFVVANNSGDDLALDEKLWDAFVDHIQIDDGGLTRLHKKYLEILEEQDRPLGVKTLAIQLGINEKAVEEDIEPLLMKLGKIEKTAAGRILLG